MFGLEFPRNKYEPTSQLLDNEPVESRQEVLSFDSLEVDFNRVSVAEGTSLFDGLLFFLFVRLASVNEFSNSREKNILKLRKKLFQQGNPIIKIEGSERFRKVDWIWFQIFRFIFKPELKNKTNS